MRTLIIGIGNLLRTDDGVGIHVINLIKELQPQVETLDAAMGSIEILEAMRGYDRAIIVDAIETGAEPGTIYRVNFTSGEKPLSVTYSHGTDLITTLKLGQKLFPDEMPREIIIIAVEAEDTSTINDIPTKKVQSAIKQTVKDILDNIDEPF